MFSKYMSHSVAAGARGVAVKVVASTVTLRPAAVVEPRGPRPGVTVSVCKHLLMSPPALTNFVLTEQGS